MATAADQRMADRPINEQIIYLETQTWEALKQSGTALVPYLAPDCVMIFPGSMIFDQHSDPSLTEILQRSDMKPWTKYDMSDVRVVGLGRDSAMICYSVDAAREKQAYSAIISSVWRRTDDSWKMVLHQQTPSLHQDTPPPAK